MLDLKDFKPDPIHIETAQAFSSDDHFVFLMSHVAKMTNLGHLCLPISEFNPDDQNRLFSAIQECPKTLLSIDNHTVTVPIYYENDCLYLHKSYRAEKLFELELKRYLNTLSAQETLYFSCDPELADNQNLALEKALFRGMLILTGGPGTGKTFTAKKIAHNICQKSSFFKKTLILTAPTSKAVDNLRKSIGELEDTEIISDTLHKLVNFFSKKPAYLNASCIIVDEASMIEAPLMARLFASLGSGAKLILMGDPHQLPPVGLGSFFQDLIEMKDTLPYVHHVHLDKIHRCQIKELIELATLSNASNYSEFMKCLRVGTSHLKLIDLPLKTCDEQSLAILKSLFQNESFYTDDLSSMSDKKIHSVILSTLRQGLLGVDHINQVLSDYFKSKQHQKRYYLEPIMILETNKEEGFFNGEIGFKIYDRMHKSQSYYLKNKHYPNFLAVSYTPAFALSVHKSQGSEFDHVLFMLPQGSEKFSKEIIYTAITRVKKTLWIWLDDEPLKEALNKKSERFSGIKRRFSTNSLSTSSV